jgi:hypothetical protein
MYSGGEAHFVETLLIHALPHLTDWLREVTLAGRNKYRNPNMIVMYRDAEDETLQFEPDWSKWQNAPLHDQPPTDFGQVDPKADISDDGKENDGGDGNATGEDSVKGKGKGKENFKADKVVIDDLDEDDRDQEIKDLERSLMMMDKVAEGEF